MAGFWDYPQAPPVPSRETAAAAAQSGPSWAFFFFSNMVVGALAHYGSSMQLRGAGKRVGYMTIADTEPSLELRRCAAQQETRLDRIQVEA